VGRLDAFGLRAAKPGGPPIGSGPGCIWVGGATAAATMTVFCKFWASWPSAGTQFSDATDRSRASEASFRIWKKLGLKMFGDGMGLPRESDLARYGW